MPQLEWRGRRASATSSSPRSDSMESPTTVPSATVPGAACALMVAQHVNFFPSRHHRRGTCAVAGTKSVPGRYASQDPGLELKRKRSDSSSGAASRPSSPRSPVWRAVMVPEPPERRHRVADPRPPGGQPRESMRKDHLAECVVPGLEKDMGRPLVARFSTPRWQADPGADQRPAHLAVDPEAGPASPTLVALAARDRSARAAGGADDLAQDAGRGRLHLRAARSSASRPSATSTARDNLASKGTIHLVPDIYIVWNEAARRGSRGTPRYARAAAFASPEPRHVDRFFEMRPKSPAEAMRQEMGCARDGPYVVFSAAPRTLIPRTRYLGDGARPMRCAHGFPERRPDAGRCGRTRPIPTPWGDTRTRGVVVYPAHGDQADSPKSWQDYSTSSRMPRCCFGLNTTAFFEAVVVDRPCLTIVADEFWASQAGPATSATCCRGDFLEVSQECRRGRRRESRGSLPAPTKKAGPTGVLRGWFLRPSGLDRPRLGIVANVIERAALQGRAPAARHAARRTRPGLDARSRGRDREPGRSSRGDPDQEPARPGRNAVPSVLEQTDRRLRDRRLRQQRRAPSAADDRQAVRGFGDPRIIYVRTSGRLSMPDNWERADHRGPRRVRRHPH